MQGYCGGGRVDDMRHTVWSAALAGPETIPYANYWGEQVRQMGIGTFVYQYNDGRQIGFVALPTIAAVESASYFYHPLRWLLVGSLAVLLGGVLLKRTRLLAGIGLATLLSTAAVFGYLLMDNVRFIILPLLFTAVTATGVADLLWSDLVQARRVQAILRTDSRESLEPGSSPPGA